MHKVVLEDLAVAFGVMAEALQQGVEMSHALLRGQVASHHPRVREALGTLVERWNRDGALSEGMKGCPDIFQPEIIELTEIGINERSLSVVWQKASEAYRELAALKSDD